MLSKVTAVRFDRRMSAGRTKPCLMGCVDELGKETELVVKFAAGCEMKQRSLVAEAIAALLAADLDLPVPEPFLVRVDADFAATIPDDADRTLVQAGLGWNFGSRKLPAGYKLYVSGERIPRELVAAAGEIVAFDHLIANPDRTAQNPNLLFNGRAFAMYDHELAFFTEGILGWRPPWEPGGAPTWSAQRPDRRHVLWDSLHGKPLDLSRLEGAFDVVTPERLLEYQEALPESWIGDGVALTGMLGYIVELKDRIAEAIKHVTGALR